MSNDRRILPSGKGRALSNDDRSDPWKSGSLYHKFGRTDRPQGVRSVNVSADNKYLIITNESRAGKIRVVDLDRLEFLSPSYAGHSASVRLTSINKENTEFFTGSWDGTARRFNIHTGECTELLSGFGRCPSVLLDPEDRYLFTCSYDSDLDFESGNTGRCWDLSTRQAVNFYPHSNDRQYIECMDIAFDQEFVYTGSDDGCAYRWPITGGLPILQYFTCKGSVRKVAVSRNYFAAACTDGCVRVYQKISGELVSTFLHDEPDVREVRISKDESRLFSGSADGSVSCFNLVTKEMLYRHSIHANWIWSICLMNDDRVLVTGSRDGRVAFLSTDSGKTLAQLMNFPAKDDFLITCPPDKDKGFPNGLFYTTNTGLVQVFSCDKEKSDPIELKTDDTRREAYIRKHNLKNLIVTRLKNEARFNSLTAGCLQQRSLLDQVDRQQIPKMLNANNSTELS